MIASLGGDVKLWPCLLHPSFISQSRRGHKNPHYRAKTGGGGGGGVAWGGGGGGGGGGGSFLGGVVSLSRITHHSYHGLWVDYCKLIKGLIAAASGALCAEANS